MLRSTLILIGALFAPIAGHGSEAANYPEKPIRIVVPYLPGGAADVITRRIAERLSQRVRQPVIIDNKPGGNTLIGTEAVAKAAPDGYTLYSTNTTLVQMPFLYPGRYDARRDFKPIAQYAESPLALAVLTSVPANNVKEFVAHMKSRPEKTTYGTSGVGGTQHIFSEAFKRATGVDSVQVPFRGEPPLVLDFIGGRVDWFIATPHAVYPHVKAGKVKLLAVTGQQRFDLAPTVPTFKEEGITDLVVVGWYALFTPAATPAPIIEKLSKEVSEIVRAPEFSQFLRDNGLVPTGLGHQEFEPKLRETEDAFGRMIRENSIRID
jgi:tripartite-type tricarboxylate transporter receptor subunit TctC